jgi:hypothetical protein
METQYVDFIEAHTNNLYNYYKGADPNRLLKILKSILMK